MPANVTQFTRPEISHDACGRSKWNYPAKPRRKIPHIWKWGSGACRRSPQSGSKKQKPGESPTYCRSADARSLPLMVVTVIGGECAGREIMRAGMVAAVGHATADRRTSSLQRGPVGRQPGRGSWRPSIQNVQIGIVEREQARLLDGSPHSPVRVEVVPRII